MTRQRRTAIQLAESFATDQHGRGRQKSDWWLIQLSAKQSKYLADLMRGEGYSYKVTEGFGLVQSERFRPISDGTFSAKLGSRENGDPMRTLYYRWSRDSRFTGAASHFS